MKGPLQKVGLNQVDIEPIAESHAVEEPGTGGRKEGRDIGK